jgi:hypothetical protein
VGVRHRQGQGPPCTWEELPQPRPHTHPGLVPPPWMRPRVPFSRGTRT